MVRKTILLVDDEPGIISVVSSYLEREDYLVLAADCGYKALEIFRREQPDLIILDLMLPDISGQDVCRSVRQISNVPIIMLTARVEETDILEGLKIGADDYVTKPFSPRQLLARVSALLRRSGQVYEQESDIIRYGGICISTAQHKVVCSGREIHLTPVEFRLLTALASHPRKVFTREELILQVFGPDFNGTDRSIDSHIKNLRQKIESDPHDPALIVTVHGTGYRLGECRC